MSNDDRGSLLAWQWTHYPEGHADRTNLVIHALTAPAFWTGLLSVIIAPIAGSLGSAALGLVAIVVAVAAQGRGHGLERVGPKPFRGPLDVVARLVVEQLVTFPRFVLSGGFARAWRRAR